MPQEPFRGQTIKVQCLFMKQAGRVRLILAVDP
jgi:hypothetical protein